MYVGCVQKIIVAPPIILFAWAKVAFNIYSSSLKPPVGGASYYVIIFLNVGLS